MYTYSCNKRSGSDDNNACSGRPRARHRGGSANGFQDGHLRSRGEVSLSSKMDRIKASQQSGSSWLPGQDQKLKDQAATKEDRKQSWLTNSPEHVIREKKGSITR